MSIQSINHVQLALPAGAEAPIRRFYASLLGLPGNLASVTGASGPRILGAIHPA